VTVYAPQADDLTWHDLTSFQVRFAELRFDSPPLVLGRGTFGQVTMADNT
jgi:hypothetical protein